MHVVRRPIWERLEDEAPADYDLFCWWVGKRCPALTGDMLYLASKNDWTRRANAMRTADSQARDPRAQIRRIRQSCLDLLEIECEKYVARAREEIGVTVSATDLARIRDIMMNVDLADTNASASSIDLSDLPDSSFEILERAVDIARKVNAA